MPHIPGHLKPRTTVQTNITAPVEQARLEEDVVQQTSTIAGVEPITAEQGAVTQTSQITKKDPLAGAASFLSSGAGAITGAIEEGTAFAKETIETFPTIGTTPLGGPEIAPTTAPEAITPEIVEPTPAGLEAAPVTEQQGFIGVDKGGEQKLFDSKEQADKSKTDLASKQAAEQKTKEIEQERTGLFEDASESIKQGLAFFNDLADPNTPDPVYERQLNQFLSTVGPQNFQSI